MPGLPRHLAESIEQSGVKGTLQERSKLVVRRSLRGKCGEHTGGRLAVQPLRGINEIDAAREAIDTGNHVPGGGKPCRALPPGSRRILLLQEEGASTVPSMGGERIRLRRR